ncbi:hypothetical protein SUGI_0941930 [Cryptomeria japonica]|uniref:uncharacterized protein LOC131031955 n=1 Tax=Cryptomeria japonica TaxID=3369 RepID=UPI002414702C|nr:uncharacterized protein LOC131031955 [Cryptomeria japonica]GLJ44779.1 hypothetical protein SUGI_0941930 [Cryptomeria japonica]
MCVLLPCFGVRSSSGETRVRNLTEGPVEVQIRVGSALRKAYRVGSGCAKTLKCSKIRDHYSRRGETAALFNGNGEPYVWIDSSKANWATAKKQYLTLDDLRICSEVKICSDSGKGAFTVLKISRSKAY